jgi:hypothetical protein
MAAGTNAAAAEFLVVVVAVDTLLPELELHPTANTVTTPNPASQRMS